MSLIVTTCVCVDVLPVASMNVHVIVVFVEIGNAAVVVPVICPEQLSVAVGAEMLGTGHVDTTGDKLDTFATGVLLSPTTTL